MSEPLMDVDLEEITSAVQIQMDPQHKYDVMIDNATLSKVLRLVDEVHSLRSSVWIERAAEELADYIEQWDGPFSDGSMELGPAAFAEGWLVAAVLRVLKKHRGDE